MSGKPAYGPETVVGGRRVREHVLIAERALGRPLPRGVEVHHVDGNGRNNQPGNLVVCQDRAYHKLLHRRAAALAACGNADYRQCRFCREWDDPANLTIRLRLSGRDRGGEVVYHRACSAEFAKRHYHGSRDAS